VSIIKTGAPDIYHNDATDVKMLTPLQQFLCNKSREFLRTVCLSVFVCVYLSHCIATTIETGALATISVFGSTPVTHVEIVVLFCHFPCASKIFFINSSVDV
jgi:hypothetical protein